MYKSIGDYNIDSMEEVSFIKSNVYKLNRKLGVRMSAEDVEDVVSNVFIHLWEKGIYQKKDRDIKGYIYTSVRNHIINIIKSAGHRNNAFGYELNVFALESYYGSVEETATYNILVSDIEKYLKSEDDKKNNTVKLLDVFNLRLIGGKLKELAELKNVSYTTAWKVSEVLSNKLRLKYAL